MSEIERFIELFAPARDLFLYGMCYWFALILTHRFSGSIYYLPVRNHFVTRLVDRFYDASGDVTESLNEKPVSWTFYQCTEPRHASKIYAQCVLKLEEDDVR